MVAIMVNVAALQFGGPVQAVRGILIVVPLTVIPVLVLMVRQARRGARETVDASRPRERPVFFAAITLGVISLVGYLFVMQPRSPLLRGAPGEALAGVLTGLAGGVAIHNL
jgi:hypothetical protein